MDVIFVSSSPEHSPPLPDTAGDAALAEELQQEERLTAGRRVRVLEQHAPPPPSAPPLTGDAMQADWAEEWWAQMPGQGSEAAAGTQQQQHQGQGQEHQWRQEQQRQQADDEGERQQRAAQHRQRQQQQRQEAADQELAQQLYEAELRELTEDQRQHLSSLPARLRDSSMVRALSERLSGLSGLSFTKVCCFVASTGSCSVS